MITPLNTLGMSHDFLRRHIPIGGFCIDATAGKGRDTLFLCQLVGSEGKVVAVDIQAEAVEATRTLVKDSGCRDIQIYRDDHANLDKYARPGTVDGIVFNFGWLPGGRHDVFTTPQSSIPAITKGLELLKEGGVMSLCIYYGGENGFVERDAILEFLPTLDCDRYTALVQNFVNRPKNPPIPVMIWKRTV